MMNSEGWIACDRIQPLNCSQGSHIGFSIFLFMPVLGKDHWVWIYVELPGWIRDENFHLSQLLRLWWGGLERRGSGNPVRYDGEPRLRCQWACTWTVSWLFNSCVALSKLIILLQFRNCIYKTEIIITHDIVRIEHANICKIWLRVSTQKSAVVVTYSVLQNLFQWKIRQGPSVLLAGVEPEGRLTNPSCGWGQGEVVGWVTQEGSHLESNSKMVTKEPLLLELLHFQG